MPLILYLGMLVLIVMMAWLTYVGMFLVELSKFGTVEAERPLAAISHSVRLCATVIASVIALNLGAEVLLVGVVDGVGNVLSTGSLDLYRVR